MTTRYRVEYALKSHRRDQLIEWIKGLLAVPFVLHSQPTAIFEPQNEKAEDSALTAQRRYLEIMRDVEELINDHIRHQQLGTEHMSKLRLLVPAVGAFFTPLYLHDAFLFQDQRRFISRRRFVAPSFNDIRLVLNTSQVMSLVRFGPIELITFDGDVTLYDDGRSLEPNSPLIPRILDLLQRGTKIGLVTAAGYTDAQRYYERLHGLLDAIHSSTIPSVYKEHLIVMGGEANYLFVYSSQEPSRLKFIPREQWLLDEMKQWTEADIQDLLDHAESTLKDCVKNLNLEATIIRKDRAVGIIPNDGQKFPREALEETVLVTQKVLVSHAKMIHCRAAIDDHAQEISPLGKRIAFCAFNGGNDVFVDIGDKNYGVRICQNFFNGIQASKTLHVGDQFLSAGSNDFKARSACTTAWIANPRETLLLLDEIAELDRLVDRKKR